MSKFQTSTLDTEPFNIVSRLKFRTLQTFTIPAPPSQCSQLAVFSVTGAGAVTVGVLRPHQWPCYWPHWSA